jgi:hypothetical protein
MKNNQNGILTRPLFAGVLVNSLARLVRRAGH